MMIFSDWRRNNLLNIAKHNLHLKMKLFGFVLFGFAQDGPLFQEPKKRLQIFHFGNICSSSFLSIWGFHPIDIFLWSEKIKKYFKHFLRSEKIKKYFKSAGVYFNNNPRFIEFLSLTSRKTALHLDHLCKIKLFFSSLLLKIVGWQIHHNSYIIN